jgi:hypothetical protein
LGLKQGRIFWYQEHMVKAANLMEARRERERKRERGREGA